MYFVRSAALIHKTRRSNNFSRSSEEEKSNDLFRVNTRTIVAIGLGAAIFTLLFMFVKVPSPVPETSFQTAYGVAAFFATLFGPIAGALIAFIGHALSDAVQYGSPWWSWVIASGVAGFIYGFAFHRTSVEDGAFGGEEKSSPSTSFKSSATSSPGSWLRRSSISSSTRNLSTWSSHRASLPQS